MTTNIPAIKLSELTKIYDTGSQAKLALDSIDLEIPKGAFFALLGPNGAGKSTIINILSGMTVKSSGKVIINSYDIDTHLIEAKSSIGVVPQEVILDPFFSLEEALEFHAGYYGVPKKKRRTLEILKALGLQDKRKSLVRALSGGMKRRMLIAKALVHSPSILILDEPTAGVDVELRRTMWEYIKDLSKKGTTIILTTHYLEEAENLCDQVAVINHGRIIANESIATMKARLDFKKLKISFNEKLLELPKKINKKLFKDIDITNQGGLNLTYHSSQISIHQILDELKKLGKEIVNIETEQANLEDVFRTIVS